MAETLKNFTRSNHCGELRLADAGKPVAVCGWVQRRRDLGGLIFVTVRDRSGIVQAVFNTDVNSALFDKAATLRTEFVVAISGTLRERSAKNPDMPTGDVEIDAAELRILAEAETTPFEITDNSTAGEEVRLKYRYLDLRRPTLQRNIIMRHEIARVTREYFYKNDFIEIETPMMIRSTPEGARDYIVPSRIHPGNFYALPQSPQIYKQLLMISGFERYIQLARCFRDEDLRADRQPEFTQVDLEMSFVDVDDILKMLEGYMEQLLGEILGHKVALPFARITFADAQARFGSDKPDTRFAMEICDLSALVKDCGFSVFSETVQNGGSVRCIVAKNAAAELTRKEIDKLAEHARGIGAKGLAFIRWNDDEPNCSFAKFFTAEEIAALCTHSGCEKGDVMLIIADKNSVTLPVLGALRNVTAKKLNLIPDGLFNFVWITEMPFFEKDEETGEWLAMHHPFTCPMDECLGILESDPANVRAKAYDLVLNGVELCSGSIRINDAKLQQHMFELLGLTEEEIAAKFGFLVDAYHYGGPPHGGAGFGLDRIAMVLCGAENLRDVTAFPKVQNASELMSACPSPVDEKQLSELGISIKG